MAFANLLRQAVGWFDNKDSSPGCLTTKLARDAPVVKAVGVVENRFNRSDRTNVSFIYRRRCFFFCFLTE